MNETIQGVIVGAILGTFSNILLIYIKSLIEPRPSLSFSIDTQQRKSELFPNEIQKARRENTSIGPSWFYRLKVTNKGNKVAYKCRARLVHILTDEKKLTKIDRPLILFWAAQNNQHPFTPIDIDPNSFFYLDIIQFQTYSDLRVNNIEDILIPRILIEGGRLPSDNQEFLEPNSYYFKIGLSADNLTYTLYIWVKLQKNDSPENPFTLELVGEEHWSDLNRSAGEQDTSD